MWVQIRTMDGKQSTQVDGLSKLTKVEELREAVAEKFGIDSNRQRLFFRGKQMENGYKLFDYNVGLNDIIQLLERKDVVEVTEENVDNNKPEAVSDTDSGIDTKDANADEASSTNMDVTPQHEDALCKVGDAVDAQDTATGAWFEAKIVNITSKGENQIFYEIKFDDYEDQRTLSDAHVRPRAKKLLNWEDINIVDKVMVNYNIDKPNERGFWYDSVVLQKKTKRTGNQLFVEILLGPEKTLQPCKIVFVEEVFAIERFDKESSSPGSETTQKRKTGKEPDCLNCGDNPRRDCKECGCHVCGKKRAFDLTLLCDECNLPFHTFCLDPPLEGLPAEDEWYCPLCRNDQSEIVNAGEKLKQSKKKAKMKSSTTESERDWGKGMACVGRSKVCTIVPSNHCGPIPGVPVGTLWKFRVQVSEAGVHRPHVSGIHGKEQDTAYSIVLAGGYEDDEDNGEEFTYTGSGGRDLSGNKRTAEQSCDQVLAKNNMAIARSCNAKADSKNGAEASDWRKSRPIRVVRNYKGAKHSEYAPKEGNRYDGIYKVVKYWPEKGKSGFIVWRYLFRRDDQEPAPWSSKGKKRAKELGITMQYPEGYLEAQQKAFKDEEKKGGKKRKGRDSSFTSSPKKVKAAAYEISRDLKKLIKSDTMNAKMWKEGLSCAGEGQQDLVNQPITTTCHHNMCKDCLQRSFRADVFSCPVCRFEFGADYKMEPNSVLQQILSGFFPGYESGR